MTRIVAIPLGYLMNGIYSLVDNYALSIIIMTVIICGMEFLWMRHIYGIPYMNAPVVSLTFKGNKLGMGLYASGILKWMLLHMTIWQYMLMQFIMRLVICLILSVGIMKITRSIKNIK